VTSAIGLVLAGALSASMVAGGGYMLRDQLLRAVTPDGGATVHRSLPYGEGPRRSLDIYVPKDAERAPVALFFYGGSWQFGRKELYGFVGDALAARGIVTVIADYRVFPEVRYPDFVEDGAAATRWVQRRIGAFGGNPQAISLMGHSAGAYIAAMLALDERWLGADRARLAGLVGLSGPYDFLPLTGPTYIDIFGGSDRQDTQPVRFVTPEAPPTFLATGDRDTIVLPRNTSSLAARLLAAGHRPTEIVYPGRGHFGLILPFIGPLQFLTPVADDVAAFLHAPTQEARR